ncbi:MAG: hypothetical protein ACR2NP_15650 [Pirellulaceae bacterium]
MQIRCGFGVILLLAGLMIATPTWGQQQETLPSPDEVLDAFYEVLGGEMAIAGIEQVRITGESAEPMSGDLELLYKDGKVLMRFTSDGVSGESVTGFNGKVWWRHLPSTPDPQQISDDERAMVQHFALFTPQFLTWREHEGSTEVTDTTEFRGNRVWHLKFTDTDGQVVDRYFDQNTGLLLGARIETSLIEHVTLYEFTDIDGVMWVSAVTAEQKVDDVAAEYDIQLNFSDFDFDVDLDDEQFAGPGDQ